MSVQILDEILATDSRIRYAGILDKDLKTVSPKASAHALLSYSESEL